MYAIYLQHINTDQSVSLFRTTCAHTHNDNIKNYSVSLDTREEIKRLYNSNCQKPASIIDSLTKNHPNLERP